MCIICNRTINIIYFYKMKKKVGIIGAHFFGCTVAHLAKAESVTIKPIELQENRIEKFYNKSKFHN